MAGDSPRGHKPPPSPWEWRGPTNTLHLWVDDVSGRRWWCSLEGEQPRLLAYRDDPEPTWAETRDAYRRFRDGDWATRIKGGDEHQVSMESKRGNRQAKERIVERDEIAYAMLIEGSSQVEIMQALAKKWRTVDEEPLRLAIVRARERLRQERSARGFLTLPNADGTTTTHEYRATDDGWEVRVAAEPFAEPQSPEMPRNSTRPDDPSTP